MRACCHSGREPLHSGREPTLTACYLQALGRFVQAGFAPLPASSSILHLHPASGLRPRFRRSFPVFAPVPVLPDIDYDGFPASAVDLDCDYAPPACRGSLAGRRAAAPGLRTTCIRRAASSTGLSRYLIRRAASFPWPLCSQSPFWERTLSVCTIHLCFVFARPRRSWGKWRRESRRALQPRVAAFVTLNGGVCVFMEICCFF